MADKPSVLFVCVHNAGRSQIAAALLSHLAGDRVEVRSAGTEPADQINSTAVAAMAEIGIDITSTTPAPAFLVCPTATGNCPTGPTNHWRSCALSATTSPTASGP